MTKCPICKRRKVDKELHICVACADYARLVLDARYGKGRLGESARTCLDYFRGLTQFDEDRLRRFASAIAHTFRTKGLDYEEFLKIAKRYRLPAQLQEEAKEIFKAREPKSQIYT